MTEHSPTFSDSGALAAERERNPQLTFRDVYDSEFGFVWRAVANRGIPSAALDDVVQEVFLVVHRKLHTFEGRSTLRTWLVGIVRRVVADHVKKRGNQAIAQEALLDHADPSAEEPAVQAERRAAMALVEELLGKMSEAQREVFVLHELEQMTTREIAAVTGANDNTVQTRLKAARRIFQQGVARHRAVLARKET